jgi:uncharacterized membrane protein YcaP (DUF421 family)
MSAVFTVVDAALGLEVPPAQLTFLQVSLRGVIVFVATLVIVRWADRRFLAIKGAFDAVLGFILASMLARAVNGSSAFFPTIGGAFVLVMLHRFVASWARHSHAFGNLVKGHTDVVIANGQVDERALVRNRLSRHDLLEDLRLNGNVAAEEDVSLAVFERNGQISVVRRSRESAS